MVSSEFSKVSVRLLAKQLEHLQRLAKEKATTYNYLIRTAIAEYIEKENAKSK